MSIIRLPIALLAMAWASHAVAAEINCKRPVSLTERVLCNQPDLAQLKAKVWSIQAETHRAALPQVRKRLDRQQAEFASGLSTCGGDAPCIQARLTRRLAILQALSARVSESNPRLPDATSVALVGKWRAGPLRSLNPEKPAGPRTLENGVPDPEAEITGVPGQICAPECDAFGLEPGRLDGSAEGRALARALGINKSGKSYLAYVNGRASFTIVPMSDGRLAALMTACGPQLQDCAPAMQEWFPGGAGAILDVLQP